MTEFTSFDPGTPCWVDLMSPDVDASKQFYSEVFGWDAEDQLDPEGNRIYVMFSQDGRSVAGLGGQSPDMEGMPPMWNTYVSTADLDSSVAKVAEAGGAVMMPPMDVMTAGRMAVCADPAGAVFSMWQPGDHIGFQIGNAPDTFSWNELMSRDLGAAKTFYSRVFGWEYDVQQMSDDSEYHVIAGGENNGLGGMMPMPAEVPDEVPSHWMPYVMVADINATVDKVDSAGGGVVAGPFPIPGVGQIAVIHDAQGGAFSLMQAEGA